MAARNRPARPSAGRVQAPTHRTRARSWVAAGGGRQSRNAAATAPTRRLCAVYGSRGGSGPLLGGVRAHVYTLGRLRPVAKKIIGATS